MEWDNPQAEVDILLLKEHREPKTYGQKRKQRRDVLLKLFLELCCWLSYNTENFKGVDMSACLSVFLEFLL